MEAKLKDGVDSRGLGDWKIRMQARSKRCRKRSRAFEERSLCGASFHGDALAPPSELVIGNRLRIDVWIALVAWSLAEDGVLCSLLLPWERVFAIAVHICGQSRLLPWVPTLSMVYTLWSLSTVIHSYKGYKREGTGKVLDEEILEGKLSGHSDGRFGINSLGKDCDNAFTFTVSSRERLFSLRSY